MTLRADITSLERQRGFTSTSGLRTDIRALTEERGHLQTQIEADVEKQNSDKEQPVLGDSTVLQRDCRRSDQPQGLAECVS